MKTSKKHTNELIAPYKATIKQLSTKLKKANRELKLAELEFWADRNKIKRLEKRIAWLNKYSKKVIKDKYTLLSDLTESKYLWQVGFISLVIVFLVVVFWINYNK